MKHFEEWDAWDEVQKKIILKKRATDGVTMLFLVHFYSLGEIHMLLQLRIFCNAFES